ncbi:hypothetical protein [Spiroplasma sp. BIUS-1]|uniref:hypothetical protein n=1 Tax=Spiroplasma sp. BIUS-1 TaxID=216964 RepID=UPI0013996703|nr:hypothetical protein [Spiroplasma sp. BIUS-1]QHX36831.1 hypothetical protein SBIUS_v1c05780 [Spiroplasma sp. BIUS-1]
MKKLKSIFTINRGIIISRHEHFENNCPNCKSNTYFIKQQWNYESKKFCIQINKKFITQKGDILIKTNYPFKIKYIKDNENLVVSANHIIIKSSLVANLIDTEELSIFLEKKLINPFLKAVNNFENKYSKTLNKNIIENFKINIIDFKNKMRKRKVNNKDEVVKTKNYLDKKILSINDLLEQKVLNQKQFDELKNEIIDILFN